MNEGIISPKLDIMFKSMFSQEENEDMLHDFLATALDLSYDSIKKIDVLNSDVLPDDPNGKFSRMDMKLHVDDRLVNVEMQISSQSDYKDRTLYYWAKMYSDSLKKGSRYSELKQSIAINIIDFNMFNCKEFHSQFKVMETERHELLSDKCAIHFFELKKINKEININNRIKLWLQLINAESEEDLIMLQETNVPIMQKAVMTVRKLSADEIMREKAYMREKALHDEASALGGARDEGRAEGRAQGRAEERAEIISNMRTAGMTEEQIKAIIKE